MKLGKEAVLAIPVFPGRAPHDPHYRGWFEWHLSDEDLVTYRAVSDVMQAKTDIRATLLRASGSFQPAIVNAAPNYEFGASEVALRSANVAGACVASVRAMFADDAVVGTVSLGLDELGEVFADVCWREGQAGDRGVPVPRPVALSSWSTSARELFTRRYPSAVRFWSTSKVAA